MAQLSVFLTASTGRWYPPADCHTLDAVDCISAGGAATAGQQGYNGSSGGTGGNGGGGGGFSRKTGYVITDLDRANGMLYYVAAPGGYGYSGLLGSSGSWISLAYSASGQSPGYGSVGDVLRTGGYGAPGAAGYYASGFYGGYGGGGGGAAGLNGNGINASAYNGGYGDAYYGGAPGSPAGTGQEYGTNVGSGGGANAYAAYNTTYTAGIGGYDGGWYGGGASGGQGGYGMTVGSYSIWVNTAGGPPGNSKQGLIAILYTPYVAPVTPALLHSRLR